MSIKHLFTCLFLFGGIGDVWSHDPLYFPDLKVPSLISNPTCFGSRMHKIMFNQSNYVQYAEYMTEIPTLASFTTCYWFNLIDVLRKSTFVNYGILSEFNYNLLTIQYEVPLRKGSALPTWTIQINDELVASATSSNLIAPNTWHHACQSWDGKDGTWAFYVDGDLLKTGTNYQTIGEKIKGGGFLISGQHLSTTVDGMDRAEGVVGWMTLFHFDNKPIPYPSSSEARLSVRWLSKDCKARDLGSIVGWLRTTRKCYGGLAEAPADQVCHRF